MPGSPLTSVSLNDPIDSVRGFRNYVRLAGVVGPTRSLLKIPSGEFGRFTSVRLTLVTDATVANRSVVLQLRDPDGLVVLEALPGGVVAASLTQQLNWARNYNGVVAASGLVSIAGLWDDILEPGWELFANVVNGAAGDTIGPVAIVRETYVLGPDGYPYGWQRTP